MGQLVKHPTLAQVMTSWFVGSSSTSGSVLTAQRLEPASDSVSPPLFAPPLLTFHFSFSHKEILKKIFLTYFVYFKIFFFFFNVYSPLRDRDTESKAGSRL